MSGVRSHHDPHAGPGSLGLTRFRQGVNETGSTPLPGAKTPNRNELCALRGSTSSTGSRRRRGYTCASSQPLASRSTPSTALASRPDFAPTVRRATDHMPPATTPRSFSIRTTTTSRRSTATSVIRDTCRRGTVPRGSGARTLAHAAMPFLGGQARFCTVRGYAPGGDALPFQLREGGRSERVSAA